MKVIWMLGIYKAATLDKTTEFDFLMDHTTIYVQETSACPLKPHMAWIGGLGLTHLKAHQLSAKLCSAIKHLQADTKTGKKFLALFCWAQISAGTDIPILDENRHLRHLEGKWLCTLLEDMHHIKYKLHLPCPWFPPSKCKHDQCTMDVVLDIACIHHLHLNPINWSRLFIRARFISDISSADGKYLASIFY
eukprot:15361228-Ditylum_brightwellii.AAC.1